MRPRTPLFLLCAAALGWSGCVEDYYFTVRQNQDPGSSCEATTSKTQALGAGILDISARQGYYMNPLVENNLGSTGVKNRLQMDRFDVSLDMSEVGGEFPEELTSFEVPRSGPIEGNGVAVFTNVEVMLPALVQMIPAAAVKNEPWVTVSIHAHATRLNTDKESAGLDFPVKLCSGCLVDLREPCPATDDSTIVRNACGWPQEEPVTCCKPQNSATIGCFSGK